MGFYDDILNAISLRPARRNFAADNGSIYPGTSYPDPRHPDISVTNGYMAGGQAGSVAQQISGDSILKRIQDSMGTSMSAHGMYAPGYSDSWGSNPNAERSIGMPGIDKYAHPGMGGAAGSQLMSSGAIHPPTIEDILARLEQLQDPSRFMLSQGDLEKQAMASASQQYDPIIAGLQQQEESSTARANRNKVALGQMFNSLSGSLQGDIPAINQEYAGDKATSKKQFAALQGQIKQQYANTQAEQEAMMKRLGIEAAGATTLPQQQKDRDYFTNLAATEGQTEQSALGQEQRGTVDYTRQGSELARTEGTQRQADLMTQLQDLLAEYESQIGANKAAKQNAYVSGLGQLQQQMQKDAYDRADRESSNYVNMINLGRDLKADQYKYGQTQQSGPVKSPADIAKRVLGLGMNPRQAQSIEDVFMSGLSKDPLIQSGTSITGQAIPKEQLAQRIVQMGRERHFSQAALNALMTAALEYFGRR